MYEYKTVQGKENKIINKLYSLLCKNIKYFLYLTNIYKNSIKKINAMLIKYIN